MEKTNNIIFNMNLNFQDCFISDIILEIKIIQIFRMISYFTTNINNY
jgi:hypothetical protein